MRYIDAFHHFSRSAIRRAGRVAGGQKDIGHRDPGRRRVRLHPHNVISITDGQIFLEASLFFSGIRRP